MIRAIFSIVLIMGLGLVPGYADDVETVSYRTLLSSREQGSENNFYQ